MHPKVSGTSASEVRGEVLQRVIERYGADPEALVEILRSLSEQLGYLSQDDLVAVAKVLKLPYSRVYGVATFYSMIETSPVGTHTLLMCEDAPCHLAGGADLRRALERRLGISFGETTADGRWSLRTVSCLGRCDLAPVVMIDGQWYGHLTVERLEAILARYEEEEG